MLISVCHSHVSPAAGLCAFSVVWGTFVSVHGWKHNKEDTSVDVIKASLFQKELWWLIWVITKKMK